jgi:cell division protein FtsL
MGVNKLVMVKNKKNAKSYVHGNVAYDIHPEKKLEVKKKPRKRKKVKQNKNLKVKLKIICTIGLVFALSFLTISRFTVIMDMSADIREVKSEIREVQKENDNIKVDLARMDNIRNIEQVAMNQYGMVVPQRDEIIYIDVKSLAASNEKPQVTAFQAIQKLLGLIY